MKNPRYAAQIEAATRAEADRVGLTAAIALFAPRAKAKPAHTPGKMNKTEARFADAWLEPRKRGGEIAEYWFEPMKLRLPADRLTYTPDFPVLWADGSFSIFEIKGYATWKSVREKSWIKVKLCATAFPMWPLTVAVWNGKTKSWDFEDVPRGAAV